MKADKFDLEKDFEAANEVDPLSVPIEEKPLSIEEEIACIKKVLDVLMTDFLALQERVHRHLG